MKTAQIHLHDEAPRIGAGIRTVEVLTEGYKWVTVRYWPGGTGGHYINQRLPKAVYLDMVV